jgi:hypothetical protein
METEKIDLYKNRNISERLAVAAEFIRQNWKVLLKNIGIIGLPFVLILGYCRPHYAAALLLQHFEMFFPAILFAITSFIAVLMFTALGGTILIHYERGTLNSQTGWKELKKNIFSLMGKALCIILLFSALIAVLFLIIALFMALINGFEQQIITIMVTLLLLILIISLLPFLSICYFPAFFSKKNAWDSIKTACILGFRNWGSLFVSSILISVLLVIISLIFSVPYEIVSLVIQGEITAVHYIFAAVASFGTLLITTLSTIFLAFQYFSIVDKEEGISLQSQIDEFDNL